MAGVIQKSVEPTRVSRQVLVSISKEVSLLFAGFCERPLTLQKGH